MLLSLPAPLLLESQAALLCPGVPTPALLAGSEAAKGHYVCKPLTAFKLILPLLWFPST